MGPVRGEIQWNEAARVLLIETVIQVEQEISNNLNLQVSGKWDRINSLLPPHLRGRTWSYKEVHGQYKCSRMFATLVEVYRGMKYRKPSHSSEQVILTKPVFDAMKKREDLLDSQRSSPMENGLKSVSTTRVSNSTGSAIDQKLRSPSINVGDAEVRWDETTRVLLIETVIQVEEEIRNNPDAKVRGKWHRINDRLPPHLRGRTWSSQQQAYNAYKSARIFGALLEVYRGMQRRLPIKHSYGKVTLTKPVFDAMKKREDLLNTHQSTPAKNGLKTGIRTRVRNSTGSAGDQKLPSSSINAGYYSKAQKKWNETALILLIKAVIRVEEEMRNNPKLTRKWNRINNLLPPHLRGRSSGCTLDFKCRRTFQNALDGYKGKKLGRCNRSVGVALTKPVLELLTKREFKLNTRRSTPSENSLNSGNPTRVSNTCSLLSDQNLLSPSMNSFTSTHTNRGHSPGRQTSGNETERKEEGENFAHTASDSKRLPWTRQLQESFVDAVNEVGGAGRALAEDVLRMMGVEGLTLSQVRSHLQMHRLRYIAKSTCEGTNLESESSEDLIATTHSPSTNHAGSSLGYASKSGEESEGPENRNDSTSSPPRHSSKSVSESFQDPETMADQNSATARVKSGFETGAPKSRECRSSTRPPSDHSPTFLSDSKACIRYDEHLHSILDKPLRNLGLEFSSLSLWVESKLIPDGKKAMYGMTSSTNQSAKRRKLNAGSTDPLDDILQQSRSKWIDLQIRASIQRLKVQFVEELKNTSMEVLQLVRRDIYLHNRSSHSSHGERRDKFSSE